MIRAAAAVCALALLGACKDPPPAEDAPATRTEAPAPGDAAPPPPAVEDFDARGDEAAALRALEARPAWEAVIDRSELLARRDDRGAVHGVLIEHEGAHWLVDEAEGDGALANRLRLPEGMEVEPPLRALVWGAWVGADGRWTWVADRVARLGPAAPPPRSPGLTAAPGEPPADAVPVSQVDRRGGPVTFAVVGAPETANDGWRIADEPGAEPVARLFLPGERESYGAQDFRTGEERWQLEPGGRYAVTVGRTMRVLGSDLPALRATGAPIALE